MAHIISNAMVSLFRREVQRPGAQQSLAVHLFTCQAVYRS